MHIEFIWDLEDDPDGNYWHIVVEGHGVTQEEAEEVLRDHYQEAIASRTSGNPLAFGWTSTGKHIVVVFERIEIDPVVVYPLTAYPTPPPRRKRK
ncbi:MAG TPA: hypothetical protein VE988_08610 [Gemmataceae bacterium]|nr:hypothetical protein [Gemmataceae bacterium]